MALVRQALQKVQAAGFAASKGSTLPNMLTPVLHRIRGDASESTAAHNVEDKDAKLPESPAGKDEPSGETQEGHGFSDDSGKKEREYGKIQEDPHKVAKLSREAAEGGHGAEGETLESTGHDTSKRTTPQGVE